MRRKRTDDDASVIAASVGDPERFAVIYDQRDRLIAALAGLTPADRDVLLLVAQEELRYEQVAAALDIPVGTVRSRLHPARVTLRAALGGTNPLTVEEEVISRG